MLSPAEVGKRIKKVRDQKRMTLRDVARKASVSATLISDIERGKTSPTINSLSKISLALDETIVHFIQDTWTQEVAHTDRKNQVTVISDRGEVQMTTLSGGISGGKLDFIEVVYRPGTEALRQLVHHGEKCALVVEGELEVTVEDNVFHVQEGETIHFNAEYPHTVRNASPGETRVLWVATPRLPILSL